MPTENEKIDAMKRVFPDAVKFHKPSEGRWERPEHLAGESGEGHDGGAFYYENAEMPPDRFYFETADEAWLDLWDEIGEYADLQN